MTQNATTCGTKQNKQRNKASRADLIKRCNKILGSCWVGYRDSDEKFDWSHIDEKDLTRDGYDARKIPLFIKEIEMLPKCIERKKLASDLHWILHWQNANCERCPYPISCKQLPRVKRLYEELVWFNSCARRIAETSTLQTNYMAMFENEMNNVLKRNEQKQCHTMTKRMRDQIIAVVVARFIVDADMNLENAAGWVADLLNKHPRSNNILSPETIKNVVKEIMKRHSLY